MKLEDKEKYITEEVLNIMKEKGEIKRLKKGSVLFSQGSSDTSLFFILKGSAKLTTRSEEIFHYIDSDVIEVKSGEAVGVLSFFDEKCHKGTATLTSDSEVLILTQDAYKKIKKENPNAAEKIVFFTMRAIRDMVYALFGRYQDMELMLKGHKK